MELELNHITEVPNLTAQYPFDLMRVGDYFTVFSHFQHCRVAASEYARKHQQCYSCRMQAENPNTGIRSMRVYRVESNQDAVDKRGRTGKRKIPQRIEQPTRNQFFGWLNTFRPSQSFLMPVEYRNSFDLMQAWAEVYSLKTGIRFRCGIQPNGTLLIARAD